MLSTILIRLPMLCSNQVFCDPIQRVSDIFKLVFCDFHILEDSSILTPFLVNIACLLVKYLEWKVCTKNWFLFLWSQFEVTTKRNHIFFLIKRIIFEPTERFWSQNKPKFFWTTWIYLLEFVLLIFNRLMKMILNIEHNKCTFCQDSSSF